jgi:hypothetical protein
MKGFKVIDAKTGKEADILTADHTFGLNPQGKLFYTLLDDTTFQQGDRFIAVPEPDTTAGKLTAKQKAAIEVKIVEALEDIYSDGYRDSTSNEPPDYCSAISKSAEIMAEIIKILEGEE